MCAGTAASLGGRDEGSASNTSAALDHLEAAHRCFVEDWCWRSTGLSVHSDDGPYHKFNVYPVGSLGAAAGVMQYDARAGISYLEVTSRSVADLRVVVHEYGHALIGQQHLLIVSDQNYYEAWPLLTYLTSSRCCCSGVSTVCMMMNRRVPGWDQRNTLSR